MENQILHDSLQIRPVTKVRQQDSELIAAKPCDRVSIANTTTDSPRGLYQQRVTLGMTECVIDLFEAIQIDKQDSERRS